MICAKGAFYPTYGAKRPHAHQSNKAICFKHLQQNQSTGSFSLKKKNYVINNYEVKKYNSL